MKDILFAFGLLVIFSHSDSFMRTVYDEPKSYWLSRRCINGTKSYTRCCKKIPNWTFGYLPNPANCRTYYKCNADKFELKRCHYNYVWNRTLQKCMKPETTECVEMKTKKEMDKTGNIDGTEMIGVDKDDVDGNGSIVEKIEVNKTIDEKKESGEINERDAVVKIKVDKNETKSDDLPVEKKDDENKKKNETDEIKMENNKINQNEKKKGDEIIKKSDKTYQKNKDQRIYVYESEEDYKSIKNDKNYQNMRNEIDENEIHTKKKGMNKKILKTYKEINEKILKSEEGASDENRKKFHIDNKITKKTEEKEQTTKTYGDGNTETSKYIKVNENENGNTEKITETSKYTNDNKNENVTPQIDGKINFGKQNESATLSNQNETENNNQTQKESPKVYEKIRMVKTNIPTKTDKLDLNEIESPYKINGRNMIIIEILSQKDKKVDLKPNDKNMEVEMDVSEKIDAIKKIEGFEIDFSLKPVDEKKMTIKEVSADKKDGEKMRSENPIQSSDGNLKIEGLTQKTDDEEKTYNKQMLMTKTIQKPDDKEMNIKTDDDEKIIEEEKVTKTGQKQQISGDEKIEKTETPVYDTTEVHLSTQTVVSTNKHTETVGIVEIEEDTEITTPEMTRVSKKIDLKLKTTSESSTDDSMQFQQSTESMRTFEYPPKKHVIKTSRTSNDRLEINTPVPETTTIKILTKTENSTTQFHTLTKSYENSTKTSLNLTKTYGSSTKSSETQVTSLLKTPELVIPNKIPPKTTKTVQKSTTVTPSTVSANDSADFSKNPPRYSQISDPELVEASEIVTSKLPSAVNQSCLEGVVNPFICCSDSPKFSNTKLSYPLHSRVYIECIDQKPVLKQCPVGSFWNLNLHRCE